MIVLMEMFRPATGSDIGNISAPPGTIPYHGGKNLIDLNQNLFYPQSQPVTAILIKLKGNVKNKRYLLLFPDYKFFKKETKGSLECMLR